MIDARELAEHLRLFGEIGVAQRTLQTWIAEGKVEAVRVGGRYLVHGPSLENAVRHAVDE